MTTIYRDTLPIIERLFRPRSVEEAISLLAKFGSDARVLAGGTDLIVLMRDRAITPRYLISITKISELDYIKYEDDMLRIGALATLRSVELSPIVKKYYLSLFEAVNKMAMIQVKNRGTVAGNICRASPAADTIPPLLTLRASVKIVSNGGSKVIPLDQFFMGPGQTCLSPYEMVTEIQIPNLLPKSGTAFMRVSRTAVDLAKVNVASAITIKDGICHDVSIALGGVAPTPIMALKAGALLKGNRLNQELIGKAALTAADEIIPITDLRSTKEYRKQVSRVLVKRAINKAWERAEKNLEE